MEPIVNGIKKKYASCFKFEHVNFHKWSVWHDLLTPIGSPEFALLDSSKKVLYRWFGVIPAEEFSAVLDPLCFT
jgi:hypothetical protein